MFRLKKKWKASGIIVLFFVVFLLAFHFSVYAGANACDPSSQICNPIKYDNIQDFLQAALQIAAQVGSVIIVLAFIYSGFLFVMARGNQEELSKAKKAITYTVIGAILVLGAWAFSVAIGNTINTITNP